MLKVSPSSIMLGRLDRRGLRQAGVVAAEEEEGLAGPVLDVLHVANKDGMVAGLVGFVPQALDNGERPVDDRRAGNAGMEADALELVLAFAGEALRNLALLLAQDVHGEGFGL